VHRYTRATILSRSAGGNEINAIPPPALTIFLRRSLTESSLTVPMKSHAVTAFGSVVSMIDAIASVSRSSALATCGRARNASPSHPARHDPRMFVSTMPSRAGHPITRPPSTTMAWPVM
jgi:hypothetical protein